MRFALLLPPVEDVGLAVEWATLAEEFGYDAVMVAEGHGAKASGVSQTLTLLAAIATRTQRVKLCPFTLLLPLHHPLEVAEQAAMVDALSSGRLILGVGSGSNPKVFTSFGAAISERASRMEEAIPLVRRLLSGETVTHSGPHYVLHEAVVTPTPRRVPQIWVGAWVPAAIRRAARLADSWAPGPTVDFETLERGYETYRNELKRCGKTVELFPVAREVYCAPTAREAALGGKRILAYYQRQYFGTDHPVLGRVSEATAEYHEPGRRFVVGDVKACVDTVSELKALGVNYLIARMQVPGTPREEALASMKLFISEVAPRFAD